MAFTLSYIAAILVITINFLYVFCEDNICKSFDPCHCVLANNSRIELSGLAPNDSHPLFSFPFQLDDNSTSYTLFYNPCLPFTQVYSAPTEKGQLACADVAGCILTTSSAPGIRPEIHAVALQNTAKFILLQDKFAITYSVPSLPKSNLSVNLQCDPGAHNPELTVDETKTSNYVKVVTLRSKCACPAVTVDPMCQRASAPTEHHGLSTGSILLITFFMILIVYIAIGMLYNFCNGAQGAELFPHLGFWNDLPQLIIDGFVHVCSCCGSRSQATYSDL